MGDADVEAGQSINYSVTVKATDMVVMICRHSVKPTESKAELELLNFTTCGKNFKIAN